MVVGRLSFGGLQSAVSVLAGLATLAGGVYSAVQYAKAAPPPQTGELLAVVHTARTDRAVPGATVEVLTPEDALVATLGVTDDGLARRSLAEGAYRVRVVAPHFAPNTREVRVDPGATAEVRFQLAAHEASGGRRREAPSGRPVSRGIDAARRFLQRLGL